MPAKSFDSRACGVLMYRRQVAVYFVIMCILQFVIFTCHACTNAHDGGGGGGGVNV